MALTRRTGARFQASIWPGFVDAMTGLLLVLMFVLTIFTVVQFVLRETIIGQGNELDQLNATIAGKDRELAQLAAQIAQLGNTLGLERQANDALRAEVGQLTSSLRRSEDARSAQATQIDSFEEQVAALLLQQDAATQRIGELEGAALTLETQLAAARDEIDAGAEAARLAAAQREVMEATLEDLRRQAADSEVSLASTLALLAQAREEGEELKAEKADLETRLSSAELEAAAAAVLRGQVADLDARLTEEEQAKIAQAAAAEKLRRDLEGAQTEITALQLSLRDQTKKAEETLSLLAATRGQADDLDKRLIAALADLDATKESAQATQESLRADLKAALAAKLAAENQAQEQLTQAEQRSALLSQAQTELENQRDISTEAQRQVELLSQQIAALQNELGVLGGLLDASEAREDALQIDIANLGSRLNGAMAEALFNARRVTALEAAEAARLKEERDRLAAEAKELKNVRSRFLAGCGVCWRAEMGWNWWGTALCFRPRCCFRRAGQPWPPQAAPRFAVSPRYCRTLLPKSHPKLTG